MPYVSLAVYASLAFLATCAAPINPLSSPTTQDYKLLVASRYLRMRAHPQFIARGGCCAGEGIIWVP